MRITKSAGILDRAWGLTYQSARREIARNCNGPLPTSVAFANDLASLIRRGGGLSFIKAVNSARHTSALQRAIKEIRGPRYCLFPNGVTGNHTRPGWWRKRLDPETREEPYHQALEGKETGWVIKFVGIGDELEFRSVAAAVAVFRGGVRCTNWMLAAPDQLPVEEVFNLPFGEVGWGDMWGSLCEEHHDEGLEAKFGELLPPAS